MLLVKLTMSSNKEMDQLRDKIQDTAFVELVHKHLVQYWQWKKETYESRLVKISNDELKEYEKMKTGLSVSEIKVQYPHLFLVYATHIKIREIIERLNKRLTTTVSGTQEQLMRSFEQLKTLHQSSCKDVRELLIQHIYSLRNGYKQFVNVFANILLLGPAGVGKTTVAKTIAKIYSALGLVMYNDMLEITTGSFIGPTLKETATQTEWIGIQSLDRVVLFDEAYEIGCTPPGDFRSMAVTEMVKALDTNKSLSVLIAAGYEKEMKQCFLGANQGMERRFIDTIRLTRYTIEELYILFSDQVGQKLCLPFPFSPLERDYLLTRFKQMEAYSEHDLFAFQAGDVLNLTTLFVRRVHADRTQAWKPGDFLHNRPFLDGMLDDYIYLKLGTKPRYETPAQPKKSKTRLCVITVQQDKKVYLLFKKHKWSIHWTSNETETTITSKKMDIGHRLLKIVNRLFDKGYGRHSMIKSGNDLTIQLDGREIALPLDDTLLPEEQLYWQQWFDLLLFFQ